MELKEKIIKVYQVSKNYPEIARGLTSLGIEGYTADVATSLMLYRMAAGENLINQSELTPRNISPKFDLEKTIQAIKDSQQGKIMYPEFMEAIAKSGVRFYEATLTGTRKRVTYIGTGGHYEELIPM
jgi:uncharacterized protein YbcV (DUF1398 family)